MGVNYYVTSERWLDHRPERYPAHHRGYRGVPARRHRSPRALATPTAGIAPLLQETWDRYGLPMAVTEAHIDANREDQLRWLLEIWEAAKKSRTTAPTCAPSRSGRCSVPSTGTAWSPECRGYYEPGPFDVRGPSRARPRWRA
jgi:dTDP-4-dehydrorhamnose reductase